MHDLALSARHWLQRDGLPRCQGLLRCALGRIAQHGLAATAIVLRINHDRRGVFLAPQHHGVDQVLDGINRVAVLANQQAKVVAFDIGDEAVGALSDGNRRLETDAATDRRQDLFDPLGQRPRRRGQDRCARTLPWRPALLALHGSRGCRGIRRRNHGQLSKHPRGLAANAHQAALALRQDLKLNRLFIQPGVATFELAGRCPARLAHRLTRAFDRCWVVRHQLAFGPSLGGFATGLFGRFWRWALFLGVVGVALG